MAGALARRPGGHGGLLVLFRRQLHDGPLHGAVGQGVRLGSGADLGRVARHLAADYSAVAGGRCSHRPVGLAPTCSARHGVRHRRHRLVRAGERQHEPMAAAMDHLRLGLAGDQSHGLDGRDFERLHRRPRARPRIGPVRLGANADYCAGAGRAAHRGVRMAAGLSLAGARMGRPRPATDPPVPVRTPRSPARAGRLHRRGEGQRGRRCGRPRLPRGVHEPSSDPDRPLDPGVHVPHRRRADPPSADPHRSRRLPFSRRPAGQPRRRRRDRRQAGHRLGERSRRRGDGRRRHPRVDGGRLRSAAGADPVSGFDSP